MNTEVEYIFKCVLIPNFYYRVMNVRSISLSEAKVQFKSSHDHSKWAVASDGKNKNSWVCVGDINRAVS